MQLYRTHTQSTTKGAFTWAGGRRWSWVRAAPLTLYSVTERADTTGGRLECWGLSLKGTAILPGDTPSPPPEVGLAMLVTLSPSGCTGAQGRSQEQDARSGGGSRTGSRTWRCALGHPEKAACLSLPSVEWAFLAGVLGVLWRWTASRGSSPPASYLLHLWFLLLND